MSDVDWEFRYQNQDTPWDKGVPHPALEIVLQKTSFRGSIIVPGCGRGSDLQRLARAYPDHAVTGIDLSASAVRDASMLCKDLPHVQVRQADFFDESQWSPQHPPGLIWEHTCFCAIPPSLRDSYVARVAQLLPSGALLVGVFFTNLDDGGSGPPWNCPLDELQSRFSPWFSIEKFSGAFSTFPNREGEESLLFMTRK
jgi:hypothetical protein